MTLCCLLFVFISKFILPILSLPESPSTLSSISSFMESHDRVWIYTELYSTSVCSDSSAEYAFGVSTDSCVSHSPFYESFFALFPLVKSFKIEGTGTFLVVFYHGLERLMSNHTYVYANDIVIYRLFIHSAPTI